ncbi:formate dehydrogenase subunit alpha [Aurantimonas marianensis]|uniref:Formate dehydrogenase subunit alpha n=1 Tax=Aurantimonas marianensis TaxID=2920428 RepID=A0A9X2H4Q0_9HYPH|nr:formate dehydrogenase subunit alpha [Aurantimonas marianensis]
MLQKKASAAGSPCRNTPRSGAATVSRRSFLRNSGLAVVGLAGASALRSGIVSARTADQPAQETGTQVKKTICPFCAVGCSIWAEVQNGVWIGQEPAFESPINLGTHCAKGAATRELAIGERRLKYPTKLENGKWVRVSWEQAIEEIGDRLLEIRETKGPDSVYWLGSAKFSNEMAYLHRKFAALWGSNNTDHQARICHSTTVAGVANTYGYGAMTNTFNDIHNSKSIFLLGGNPAEAHPVSMQHLLRAKENGARFIVVDPRFTRTAAHADEYVRIRPGTDVAFLWGVLNYILEQGWEDVEYIKQRVFGFEDIRKEVANYPLDVVADITGIPEDQIRRVAAIVARNRPGTLIWCMGLTQSTIGNNKTRAASIFQLALGNIGKSGGGANIFRGHDNVQGATDLGVVCDNLPGYYGLSEDAWKHWARVWDLPYEWVRDRFASKELMERKGMPVSRWFDGVLEAADNIQQPNPLSAMIFWGHAPNSQTRGPDLKKGLEKLDLLVIVDPVPTVSAVMGERTDGVYLLPAGSTMECAGSVTNSNRSLQWREKVVDPLFEAKSDYEIARLFAEKLGFADQLLKHIGVENGEPVAEDILREINRGMWTIGYTGQSPERLKLHMQNQELFHPTTLMGMSGPVKGEYYGLPWPCWGTPEMKHPGTPILYDQSKSVAEGGLPFRARWGVERDGKSLLAEDSYPKGSPIRDGYPEMTVAVLDQLGYLGELTPREQLVMASIGMGSYHPALLEASDGEARQLLSRMDEPEQPQAEATAEAMVENRVRRQFPDMSAKAQTAIAAYLAHKKEEKRDEGSAKQAGAGDENAEIGEAEFSGGKENDSDQKELSETHALRDKILRINWKTDLSGGLQRVAIKNGLAPFGNGKARAVVWTFPDEVPIHREPLYTPRRDLLPKYRTYDDRTDFRLPTAYWSVQKNDHSVQFPLVLTSGRLVEFEGGGDETRSNKWLAEFQQEMFAEINHADAARAGISDGAAVWVATPEGARIRVAAMLTNRVEEGTVFLPFHFAGMWMGESIAERYPEGTVPYVIGEAANTAMTYGYDVVTFMQESKASLCRIEPA